MIKSHKISCTLCEIITRKSARRLLVIEEKIEFSDILQFYVRLERQFRIRYLKKKEMELEIFIILVRLIFMHILSVFMY